MYTYRVKLHMHSHLFDIRIYTHIHAHREEVRTEEANAHDNAYTKTISSIYI